MLKVILLSLISFNAAADIKIYSVYGLEKFGKIINQFTNETGINVTLEQDKSKVLLERIKTEEGDLYIDKDFIFLNQAQRDGSLSVLDTNQFQIPWQFISKSREWVAMFYRTRTIVYNKRLVNPNIFFTSFDLGNPNLRNNVCFRESENSYNQAWVGYLIKHYGSQATYQFLGRLSRNAKRPLYKIDRDIIRAVARGECLVGLVNSYYLPEFLKRDPFYPVGLRFVDQRIGANINGYGIGVLKQSRNKSEASRFIQFITSQRIQSTLVQDFEHYPVNRFSVWSQTLRTFGIWSVDLTMINDYGFLAPVAYQMMKEQGL